MWIVDEKYENVLYKCIRYTENEKTKKLPLPYIYMAQAYLGIHVSDDHDLREQYQADKNKAIKVLSTPDNEPVNVPVVNCDVSSISENPK